MRWVVFVTLAAGCGHMGGGHGHDAGSGGIRLVQKSPVVLGTGPQTAVLPDPTSAGTVLVATLGLNDWSSLSYPPGWSLIGSFVVGTDLMAGMATNLSGVAGQQSFTFTIPADAAGAIQVSEWDGVDPVSPSDVAGGGASGVPTTTLVATTPRADMSGEAVIASFCMEVDAPAFSSGTDWTELGQGAASAPSPSMLTEYQLEAPTAIVTAHATSSVSGTYAATIMTLRPRS